MHGIGEGKKSLAAAFISKRPDLRRYISAFSSASEYYFFIASDQAESKSGMLASIGSGSKHDPRILPLHRHGKDVRISESFRNHFLWIRLKNTGDPVK